MNVLLRHTLSSVTHNPVQSLIVVISTAVITACILMCLCISSMFEQIATQWAARMFAGADIFVYMHSSYSDEVQEFFAEHEDDVQAYYYSGSSTYPLLTDTTSVRTEGIGVEDLDEFDRLTSATVIERTVNDTEYPSAHISSVLADAADLAVGDTFGMQDGTTMFVEAIMVPTGLYFDQLVARFAFVKELNPASSVLHIYLNEPYGISEDGLRTNISFWAESLSKITGQRKVVSDIGYVDGLVEDSVGGSMQLMTIAAAVITVVMACLLFSSFSVIVRGRVNEMIKFKAAGATPAQSAFILILEAALYAVVGGLIGLGVGEGLIQYLNSLLDEILTGATLATPAFKYVLALVIGGVCGIAACALPCIRMSAKPIHALLGGDERMTRRPPVAVTVTLTLATLALGTAQFFADGMALTVIGILLIAVVFVWIITSAPHFLRLAASAAKRLFRHGPAYVSMCAAPKNASVSSSLTMLAALIAFITLGTSIISVVELSGLPSSTRYMSDFIVYFPPATSTSAEYLEDNISSAMQTAQDMQSVDEVGLLFRTFGFGLSEPDAESPSGDGLTLASLAVDAAETLRMICPGVTDETVRLFAETEHPVIITRTVAGRLGIDVGDIVSIWVGSNTVTPISEYDYTVVGIDETTTSYDEYLIITTDDYIENLGWYRTAETVLLMNGDTSALPSIREAINHDRIHVYTRDGYFSAEGKDKLDTTEVIGVFTFMIYGVAGLGLINLIVITAGSRKKEFDVLRLAGLTPRGAAGYILAETGMLSVVGFVFGLLAAFFVNRASSSIVRLIGKYIIPELFPEKMLFIAVALTALFALLWALSHITAFAAVSSRRYAKRDDRMLRAS